MSAAAGACFAVRAGFCFRLQQRRCGVCAPAARLRHATVRPVWLCLHQTGAVSTWDDPCDKTPVRVASENVTSKISIGRVKIFITQNVRIVLYCPQDLENCRSLRILMRWLVGRTGTKGLRRSHSLEK